VKLEKILLLIVCIIPLGIIILGVYLFSKYPDIRRSMLEGRIGKTSEEIKTELDENNRPTRVQKKREDVEIIWNISTNLTQDQLLEKVIWPYIDYYLDPYHYDNPGRKGLQKITIDAADTEQVPYVLTAEFENGRNEMIGIRKNDEGFAWWIPECSKYCRFSKNFSSQYPEIIKRYTPALNAPLFLAF